MLVEYDDRGDVSKTTNCRGQSESYTYDAEGRVASRTWANGRTFTYAYDARGRLVTASDSETGAVTMEYDGTDRLIRIAYPDDHGFTFAYDACGRLTMRQSFDGTAECFVYDAAGRLAEVTDGVDNLYLRNTYDSTTGRLTKQTNGNGTSTDYLYDLLGRVVSIEHKDAAGKIAEALQYCYDEDGRCIRAASLLGEERYGYDDEGQLTSVEYPVGENETFAYDTVGNRTSANGATYTVNALNQYTSVGLAPRADRFTYDADGNMTSRISETDGTTTYTYDQQNRLVAVNNATKNLDWSCAYDALGNRVSVTENGTTTKRVLLPGSLPSVAAEYRNGALVKRHIVVGAVRLAGISGEAASSPLDQNIIRYYHGDLIGSTRLITDATGATKSRLSYKSFGEVRSHYGEIPAVGYVGTLGVETDATGLLFMRNRYYDPTLGRFIQRDPIEFEGDDVNLYRYVENDPLLFVDPSGLYRFRTDVARNLDRALKQSGKGNKYLNAYATFVVDFSVFAARHTRKNIWPHLKVGFVAGLRFWPSFFTWFAYKNPLVGSLLTLGVDAALGDDVCINVVGIGLDAIIKEIGKYDLTKSAGYATGKKFIDVIDMGFRFHDAIRSMTLHIANNWKSLDNSHAGTTVLLGGGDTGGDTSGGNTNPEPREDDPGDGDADGDQSDVGDMPESVELSATLTEAKEGIFDGYAVIVRDECEITFDAKITSDLMMSGMVFFLVDGLPVWSTDSTDWTSAIVTVDRETFGSGEHEIGWWLEADGLRAPGTVCGYVRNIKISYPTTKAAAKVVPVMFGNVHVASSMQLGTAEEVLPRLYCYERYIAVMGCDYSFRVSASNGASIPVSGLPDGLAIVDGCITGKVATDGVSSATISVGGTTKPVTFEVIDAPTGFAEQYASAGGIVVGPEDPKPVDETKTMTLALAQGWNWSALNVMPTDSSLTVVFAAVAFADEDMVKSADGVATYYGGSWYGELKELKPGVAYMVKKSTAGSATLTITGTTAETSVAVQAGWNWIGCTSTGEVSLDALGHSAGFSDEDMITSADAVATYYGGKWYGELKVLKPGAGYKAKFAQGGTLVFGSAAE